MLQLSDQEISELYALICHYHNIYLAKEGVRLPKLRRGQEYTKDALTLVYLAYHYPDTRIVTKEELTAFIRLYDPNVLDVQQARHLGAQKGWFILSGTRSDNTSVCLHPGEYLLKTLERPYPGFTAERRGACLDDDTWEALKRAYDYRCACCGCQEGAPHRYWKNQIVHLQKGHMDPSKPLTADNTIPQCEICNRPDRNYWVYDKKGRVIKIANPKVIDSASELVQRDIYARLYAKYHGADPEAL